MHETAPVNIAVLLVSAVCAVFMLRPALLRAPNWRATVTPLASIIGSGFLVLAPILTRQFGRDATWVMLGLCGFAYAIGSAIRFNIVSFDSDSVPDPRPSAFELTLDKTATTALCFAYVISVCYYLNLFGAFAVSLTDFSGKTAGKIVTTAVLIMIAALGWQKGFRGLERAEQFTVGVKIAVICGLLAGMAAFILQRIPDDLASNGHGEFDAAALRMAFGLLITVQGFETSRYLGGSYSAEMRVGTMRTAQWMATLIYVAYIGFASVIFSPGEVGGSETAIIDMSAVIAPVLPALLVLAALGSQFSAAVADTNGYGGLVNEISGARIRARVAYIVLAIFCIAMTWWIDIFQIISYASRAFAAYYALQCLLAATRSWRIGAAVPRTLGFAVLCLLCVAIAFLGTAVE
ncbi:MAG: hypothetical protein R3E77_05545 [Steroidobacteraceae bacterium]